MVSKLKIMVNLIVLALMIFAINIYAAPQKPYIKEENNKISLNLEKVPVIDALKWLAKFANKNIIIDQSIQGQITVFLKNLTWEQAVEAILQAHGLGQQKIGNIIHVAPLEEIVEQEKQQQNVIANKTLETVMIHLNYAKADVIAKLLSNKNKGLLTSRGSATTDARTNSLLVRDIKEQLISVKKFVKDLDVAVPQVLIESRIVNIDKSFEHELGARFGITHGHHISGTLNGANALAGRTTKSAIPIADRLNVNMPAISSSSAHMGFALFKVANGALLDVELSALESAGHAKIISNPHLIAANRQTAIIESGEEIPYQESAGQGATSTSFKKAVLKLQVTPQIAPNNKIILQLQVHQDKRSSKEVLGVPAVDTRYIATQVQVDNGQTIVLGGIYEKDKTNGAERVPFFANLPILGILFRHRKLIDNRRELLIFVTPKIIRGW